MSPTSFAVIGTGAVGGFYGARLQKAGFEVHFLLRRDYDWVTNHGLVVHSPAGNFQLQSVKAYQTVEAMPACDVILVALKTTNNELLPTLLPPLLRPHSRIVVLQNGLGNEAAIAQSLHASGHKEPYTLVGGLCFLCSNKLQPGVIEHLDYGLINLGQHGADERPVGITPVLQQLEHDFSHADIDIKLSANLQQERWKKLIWNIPFNGLSVLLNAQTNELMNDGPTVPLVKALMQEIVDTAARYRCDIPNSFLEYMLELTTRMQPYRTSMKLDFDARQEMEVETMFGNPLRAARSVGVSTPKLEMLYQQLRFLNGRIKASVDVHNYAS
ncbi:MAG: putative 2-dehydropantoate 2-reductase [Cyanobacteria bacterium P01_F01_bin.42]